MGVIKEVFPMSDDRPDVVTSLLRQKQWYLEEVRLIDLALSAIRGVKPVSDLQSEAKGAPEPAPITAAKTRKISWKDEISNILCGIENDPFSVGQMISWLGYAGIPEASEERGKGAVQTTLSRMADNSKGDALVEKVGHGTYKKKITPNYSDIAGAVTATVGTSLGNQEKKESVAASEHRVGLF